MSTAKDIRCGIIGYGGAFNMGKYHTQQMHTTGRMRLTAVCDLDPKRTDVAKADFPDIVTYNDVSQFIEEAPVDLVVLITPHNTHAPLAIQCANAGKHVITEKPMCISLAEADAMIAASRKAGTMLSVFHNRRWDGDFLTILDLVQKGVIGDVFHLDSYFGGYGKPGTWWRSFKDISGGAFFDWGAHFLYWILTLMPGEIENVTGFFHKRVWHEVTNEDQVQALIRFKDGRVADVQNSSIAMYGLPKFRILGTKGAILDEWKGSLKVKVDHEGYQAEFEVKYYDGQHQKYYDNVAAHILDGEELVVTAEAARRTIAVMDLAEQSSKSGQAMPFPEV